MVCSLADLHSTVLFTSAFHLHMRGEFLSLGFPEYTVT